MRRHCDFRGSGQRRILSITAVHPAIENIVSSRGIFNIYDAAECYIALPVIRAVTIVEHEPESLRGRGVICRVDRFTGNCGAICKDIAICILPSGECVAVAVTVGSRRSNTGVFERRAILCIFPLDHSSIIVLPCNLACIRNPFCRERKIFSRHGIALKPGLSDIPAAEGITGPDRAWKSDQRIIVCCNTIGCRASVAVKAYRILIDRPETVQLNISGRHGIWQSIRLCIFCIAIPTLESITGLIGTYIYISYISAIRDRIRLKVIYSAVNRYRVGIDHKFGIQLNISSRHESVSRNAVPSGECIAFKLWYKSSYVAVDISTAGYFNSAPISPIAHQRYRKVYSAELCVYGDILSGHLCQISIPAGKVVSRLGRICRLRYWLAICHIFFSIPFTVNIERSLIGVRRHLCIKDNVACRHGIGIGIFVSGAAAIIIPAAERMSGKFRNIRVLIVIAYIITEVLDTRLMYLIAVYHIYNPVLILRPAGIKCEVFACTKRNAGTIHEFTVSIDPAVEGPAFICECWRSNCITVRIRAAALNLRVIIHKLQAVFIRCPLCGQSEVFGRHCFGDFSIGRFVFACYRPAVEGVSLSHAAVELTAVYRVAKLKTGYYSGHTFLAYNSYREVTYCLLILCCICMLFCIFYFLRYRIPAGERINRGCCRGL